MTVAVINYNAGNIASIMHALERMEVDALLTDSSVELKSASHVILPGVGHAKPAMHYLKEKGLSKVIPSLTKPFLGICLGLQLLCDSSEEGDTRGLGIFPYQVKRFTKAPKVPHMGWNKVVSIGEERDSLIKNDYYYFVHSFFVELGAYTVASVEYGEAFSAALKRENFFSVQFHPEKSGPGGVKFLREFLAL